tara:strand:- start:2874 stop:4253 length:1380 start_codon:yes stop_codon:yes gene_type:complete
MMSNKKIANYNLRNGEIVNCKIGRVSELDGREVICGESGEVNEGTGREWVRLMRDGTKGFRIMMLLIMFFIILIVIPEVGALGITPGRTTFDFEPGKEVEVGFEVINSEGEDMSVAVFVQGEFNETVAVSDVSFSMSADETRKSLSYKFRMPQKLEPGLHTSEVVVLKLPGKAKTSEAFIGAVVGVVTQIYVHVPFPGKYVETGFSVIGPDDGKVTFVIPLVSRGDLDIVRARGTIDIFTSLNEKIETITTNEVSIPAGLRREIVAILDGSELLTGKYRAVATVIYDEETKQVEKEFSIGDRILELLQAEVNDFVLGGIAKFELLVENKWGEVIRGAFASMEVLNSEGEVMADFKSQTYDIPSFEKKILVAFWDTEGVNKGTYDSTVFLNYGQSSQRQDLKLEVKDRGINVVGVGYVISSDSSGQGDNTLMIVLITVISVLVLVNVLWFLVLRKKLKKK